VNLLKSVYLYGNLMKKSVVSILYFGQTTTFFVFLRKLINYVGIGMNIPFRFLILIFVFSFGLTNFAESVYGFK